MKGDLRELFTEMENFETVLISKIQKERYSLLKKEMKNELDQLNNLSYYNPFLNVGNWNKLLLEYKKIKNGSVFIVGFTTKKKLILEYELETMLNTLKQVKENLNKKNVSDIFYDSNCFFVLTDEKDKADYIRRIIKREKINNISFASYFAEVKKDSSKDIKNLIASENEVYKKLLEFSNQEVTKNEEIKTQD